MFYPNFILKEQIEYNVSSAKPGARASPGRFLPNNKVVLKMFFVYNGVSEDAKVDK